MLQFIGVDGAKGRRHHGNRGAAGVSQIVEANGLRAEAAEERADLTQLAGRPDPDGTWRSAATRSLPSMAESISDATSTSVVYAGTSEPYMADNVAANLARSAAVG